MRIAIVDDDPYKRTGMAVVLDPRPEVEVVHQLTQDEALGWSERQWGRLDYVVVDVFDDCNAGLEGTDLYSGIRVLEHLRNLKRRGLTTTTIALTPYRFHPLIEQRIFQAEADYLFHRWEVVDPQVFIRTLLEPSEDHRPAPVPAHVLHQYGAWLARTNEAVAAYRRSELYGRLRPRLKATSLRRRGLARSRIDAFTTAIESAGFSGRSIDRDAVDPALRYDEARDATLRLIGREESETNPPE